MKRHWIYLQLRFEAPQDVKLKMLPHRAALSGNIIVSVVSRFLKYALCVVYLRDFSATEDGNPDALQIRVPDGSRSLKVSPVNSSCVISY